MLFIKMVSATAKLNALLNLKKFAQIWAKRVVIPGWTKEKLVVLALQRKLYKTKTAASKVSNVALANQLGIDISTGQNKKATKPTPKPKPTSIKPESKKEDKPDLTKLDLSKELAQKGGFRKIQSLFKAAGLKPGTSKQTLISAYEKWKEKNGTKTEEKGKKNKPQITNLDTIERTPTKNEEEFTFELLDRDMIYNLSTKLDEAMQKIKAPPPSKAEVISLKHYTGVHYARMNKVLRGQAGQLSEETIELTNNLIVYAANGLKNAPEKMRHKGEVYRGTALSQEIIDKYKPNEIIEEKAFVSTSRSIDVSENFGAEKDNEKPVAFIIQSKSGVDVSEISETPSEQEILFPPKTKFKVLKKEVDKYGITRIYLDEQ